MYLFCFYVSAIISAFNIVGNPLLTERPCALLPFSKIKIESPFPVLSISCQPSIINAITHKRFKADLSPFKPIGNKKRFWRWPSYVRKKTLISNNSMHSLKAIFTAVKNQYETMFLSIETILPRA